MSLLFTFEQPCLALFGCEDDGAVPLRQLLCGLWVILINPYVITCDYVQKELWVSVEPLLKGMACAKSILLQPLTEQFGTDLVAIQHMFRSSLKMHLTDSNEIPNMFATSQIAILMLRTGFSVRLHFRLFCLLMDFEHSACLTEVTTLLNLEKLLRNLGPSTVHSQNAILNVLKICVAFDTSFKQNLVQTHCYFIYAIS
jgi:hypothetical protein